MDEKNIYFWRALLMWGVESCRISFNTFWPSKSTPESLADKGNRKRIQIPFSLQAKAQCRWFCWLHDVFEVHCFVFVGHELVVRPTWWAPSTPLWTLPSRTSSPMSDPTFTRRCCSVSRRGPGIRCSAKGSRVEEILSTRPWAEMINIPNENTHPAVKTEKAWKTQDHRSTREEERMRRISSVISWMNLFIWCQK